MQLSLEVLTGHGIQVLSAIGAVAAWVYQWRITRFRSRLKDDLEILKRYAELPLKGEVTSDVHYCALMAHVERTMYEAYEKPGFDWSGMLKALAVFVLGALNFVVESPPSIAALIAGTLGVTTGVAWIVFLVARHSSR